MAKKDPTTLPSVLSKANRDISTILENDMRKESELLKDLVDKVLQSNLEVKQRNSRRIEDTREKLEELNQQIEELNVEIDLVDRETVVEQLNEMIDAENKIFKARQEIRYFENEQLPDRIKQLDDIYYELTATISKENQEEQFRHMLLKSNEMYIEKQLEVTNKINETMEQVFVDKKEFIDLALTKLRAFSHEITNKEELIQEYLSVTIKECTNIIKNSKGHFSLEDDDATRLEELTSKHEEKIVYFKEEMSRLQAEYAKEKNRLVKNFKHFEENIDAELEAANKKQLELERVDRANVKDELKQLKLAMMQASQKGQLEKAAEYLKQYENLEKKSKSITTTKVAKMKENMTSDKRNETIKALDELDKKYFTEINQHELESQIEEIEFEESKVLFKFQNDYDGLVGIQEDTKEQINFLRSFISNQIELRKELAKLKLDIREKELGILEESELRELELIDVFRELLFEIKETEQKRIALLQQNTNTHKIIQLEQEYKLKQAILDIKLEQEVSSIDKQILIKRNETLIMNEKLKEEFSSEIMYQESLIKVAQKEHELQLIKVKSLYENERGLAEEQVERINIGVQVNDAFVRTTLRNQMLFAQQQINAADSEYDIRVESIALTNSQEVKYANKKIEYYRQRYEYDKNKLTKELDDKIEDLSYKLILFTGDKEHKEIQEKIDKIKAHYDGIIQEIVDRERKDKNILRYEKVINDAENRKNLAIAEANALRDQTTASFEQLLEATKERYAQIEEADNSDATGGLVPLLSGSAISSADQRLQSAIKEADELYAERIIEPEERIQEMQTRIYDLTRSDEAEKYINEKKQIKHVMIKTHKEQVDGLLREKQELIAPLWEYEVKEDISINEEDVDVDIVPYRTQTLIEEDYKNLVGVEQLSFKSTIDKLTTYTRETQLRLIEMEQTLTKSIQSAINPYKKFLSDATKDTEKQKNEIRKAMSSKLKNQFKAQDNKLFDEH